MAETIMIVDDSRAFRQSLYRFLEMEGYGVIEAEDGLDCLKKYPAASPDLVVMDVNMPGIDGFETVRRLRELTVIPILILSARSAEMDRVLGYNSGADCYLAKPFCASELLARIQAMLRRCGRQQGARARSLSAASPSSPCS